MAMVYLSLNYLDQYSQRATVAMTVLLYVLMRIVSTLRCFYFHHCIERLEIESRRLAKLATKILASGDEVSKLRSHGEKVLYVDLLFLCLVGALCLAKIVAR